MKPLTETQTEQLEKLLDRYAKDDFAGNLSLYITEFLEIVPQIAEILKYEQAEPQTGEPETTHLELGPLDENVDVNMNNPAFWGNTQQPANDHIVEANKMILHVIDVLFKEKNKWENKCKHPLPDGWIAANEHPRYGEFISLMNKTE